MILVGFVVMGLSIWLIYEQYAFDNFAGPNADAYVWIPLAIGLIITILATIGNNAVVKEKRCMLAFFALLQLCFGIVLIAFGSVFLVYEAAGDSLATTPANQLEEGSFDAWLSDRSIGTYSKCCVSAISRPLYVATIQSCTSFVSSNDTACWWNSDTFSNAMDVEDEFCNAITNPDNGKLFLCPAGQIGSQEGLETYQANLNEYYSDIMWPSGVAFVCLGSITLISFVSSVYLSCCGRKASVETPLEKKSSSHGPECV